MFKVFGKCIPTSYLQYFTICLAELKGYDKLVGNVFCLLNRKLKS